MGRGRFQFLEAASSAAFLLSKCVCFNSAAQPEQPHNSLIILLAITTQQSLNSSDHDVSQSLVYRIDHASHSVASCGLDPPTLSFLQL
eukprot:scaffold12190_cov80-Skeletonema_menzelii.AAC.1